MKIGGLQLYQHQKKNKNLQMWGNISCLRYYFSLPQWKESAGSGTTDR